MADVESRELYEAALSLVDAALARADDPASTFSDALMADAIDEILQIHEGSTVALGFLADLLSVAVSQLAVKEQRTPGYVWKRMRLLVLEQLEE